MSNTLGLGGSLESAEQFTNNASAQAVAQTSDGRIFGGGR